MTRKPVQITTATVDGDTPVYVALADDGSMWATYVNIRDLSVQQWTPLRDLPQDKDA
jgi:hypothetical protein